MAPWKEPLDLEIGDTIIWRGDGMRIGDDREGIILISPGIKGKVITRSENLLAPAARKEGLPITAGPWALVEFGTGSGWWWTVGRNSKS